MSRAKDSKVDLLLKYYPDDQQAGCPFDTGIKNARIMFHCSLWLELSAYTMSSHPHGRSSGRFHVPCPASTYHLQVAVQGRQAEVMGVQYITCSAV
jgi:hypothetical protein